jgi:uncharacterized phiE125 gp8 family phage protein
MSISASGLDRQALPEALLSLAKSHLRVDGTYDDVYLTSTIARAISWFERVTQISVNPVTWTWTPAATDFCNGGAAVPVSPVQSFTVLDGAAGDMSGNYAMETVSTHGIGLYYLIGDHAEAMSVAIVSGYETAGALDPGITDALLRYTSHLYDNREILVPGSEAQSPGWMTDVIATYWMPRA